MSTASHTYYICDVCKREWVTEGQAQWCEEAHRLLAEAEAAARRVEDHLVGRWVSGSRYDNDTGPQEVAVSRYTIPSIRRDAVWAARLQTRHSGRAPFPWPHHPDTVIVRGYWGTTWSVMTNDIGPETSPGEAEG